MYPRQIAAFLHDANRNYPVLAVVGPRQSGKTTLVRSEFSDYTYLLLELPDLAEQARSDPLGFFARYPGSLILDEVQKVPELLSYVQGIVDEPGNERRFVLTGSEHLLLSEKVSQTLAGRVRLFKLLSFSRAECQQESLLSTMYRGGYPRIHDKKLDPTTWLGEYYASYVQRDVRQVTNITNLELFDRFVRLAAGRAGQLLDYSSLASDTGISQPTAKAWLSVLQATFICFTLQPHFRNFNKRLIKSPKLYFYDTGLLCYLLRIRNETHLEPHPLYGSIFENWVVTEHFKQTFNSGEDPAYYFWRDQKGREVDLVIDEGPSLFPVEIKAGKTFHPSFLKNCEYLNTLQNRTTANTKSLGKCVHGGDESFDYKDYHVASWTSLGLRFP